MATPNRPPAVGCGANCQVITISEQTDIELFWTTADRVVLRGYL